jgi:hypothetical protein
LKEGCYPSASDIVAIAAAAAFGRPLVTNVQRGLIAEAIVEQAIGREWRWCSSDYSAWDFERADGARLEVKQAASRQSWHVPNDRPSRISFDIRIRNGRHEGSRWIAGRRRWADIYVFAHHHVTSDTADHRDPVQWVFYVVPTRLLPNQDTIALSRIQALAAPLQFDSLAAVVAASGIA